MSFKDVRDLSEHLKLLEYPNILPLQAFASNCGTLASFHIVVEILQWLADLLEPGTLLSGGTKTEDERVMFIHSTIEFFITKAAIKLNPRKLYSASAISAVELLKITHMLITPREYNDDNLEEQNYHTLNQIDISDKMDNLRNARELSADLTKRGAVMYELLTKEMKNKHLRQTEVNKSVDMAAVEKALKNATAATQIKLQATHAQLQNSRSELSALTSKLQRKSAELERTKQRLEALQKIRPAHLQEFEECEREIAKLFEKYFMRVYTRDSLLVQLEERNKRSALLVSPISAQRSVENSIPLLPEGFLLDDNESEINFNRSRYDNFDLDSDIRDEDLLQADSDLFRHEARSSALTSRRRPGSAVQSKRTSAKLGGTEKKIPLTNYWNTGDNEDSSFGSDSDLDMSELIDQKPESNLISTLEAQDKSVLKIDDSDLNSIDDISISKITAELPLRPKTANKQEHQSDEDF